MTTFSTEELIKAFAEYDYPIAYKNGAGRGMGFSDFVKMLKKLEKSSQPSVNYGSTKQGRN